MRQLLENKMTGLLLGMKLGTKNVTDVLPTLNRLKAVAPLIAEEYEKKYITILAARKQAA